VTAALNAGDVTLNGYQVGASVAGSAAGQSSDSAYSIAQAINAISAQSNVTATANATTVSGTATSGAAIAANVITINGIDVGAIAGSATSSGEAANVAAAINAISSQTGVTASAATSGSTITLTAADGRDISISGSGATSGAALVEAGLTAGTTRGSLTLSSNNSQGITISGNAPASAGLTAGTTATQSTIVGLSLASTDVLSVTDAQNAMVAIQGAINTVTSNAATLGAFQNRFSAVVTGIQTDSQNLTQSLSRIQDTNYAQESAILSQQNVLSQAGTAMLAQANQLPNQILTLLR
jgi:flagellin